MSSRKRSHPEADSAPADPRVLASREMFFTIPLRTIAVHNQPLQAFGAPLPGHLLANARVTDINTVLNGLQRASLTAVLAVLNDYFPDAETTRAFTDSVADTTGTHDIALASFADKIDMGLIAFLAKHATPSNTSDAGPSWPDTTNAPAPNTNTTTSSTTAVPPKRARVSKKSGQSSRRSKIRTACITRDDERCRLCDNEIGLSAHILPFSLQQGRRSVDFWAFVGIFKGVEVTDQLRAAALDPDPNNPDNIMNVIFLCYQCHALLDKTMISLIPQILESPDSVFPYDPRMVDHYESVVEFPAGLRRAVISILQDDGEVKRMRPGHILTLRTSDPTNLPLPHPLLLQLHAICSRMVVMRAAAGYPVLTGDSSDGDTVFDTPTLDEGDIGEAKECFGEFGTKDVSRDPAVVILELQQRKQEQEQLLQKLRARGEGRPHSSWLGCL